MDDLDREPQRPGARQSGSDDAARCDVGDSRPEAELPPYRFRWNDLARPISIIWMDIDDLAPASRRTRRAEEKQVEAVRRAIARFGLRIPLLVNAGRTIIDGHIRLEAARRLGITRIPCIVVEDLPEVETRRLALSLNKLQEGGTWDTDALRLEIGEIIEIDGDLEIPGFEFPEIEALRFGVGDEAEPDPADDFADLENEAAQVVTRPGDLWCLGDHRILCGSARDGAALAAVLDGELVDAVFTDPPYNVKINGHVRSVRGGFAEFAEASGEMDPAAFTAFLEMTLGHAVAMTRPGGVIFACMDWRHLREITAAVDTLGLHLLNICVWVKTNPGMGSLYRSQHELVVVARRPGASHTNNVQLGQFGRNRSNVWHYAGATGGRRDADDDFGAHPTVKPIRLVMDALLDVTAPGDLVLDPFLGSGTTLLAAERTRRRCVGIEIAPRYVDLVIRRWQAMTGGEAVHAESGATFGELAARLGQGGSDKGRAIEEGVR